MEKEKNMIKEIFYECKSLAYIDLSKLNTKIVEDFSGAFYSPSNFSLPLS